MEVKKILILTLLLTGCSSMPTPDELSKTVPDTVNSSYNEPTVVAKCIAEKWENYSNLFGNAIITSRKLGDGVRVAMHTTTAGLYFMADIDKTEQGSKTKTWTRESLRSYVQDEFDAVVNCQS
ncbi:hypothetical protein [uncultured Pseudoalteromonas sp.]|uniref:hypothetical protein n=1 Tax=uncultured Pseudoalteromonas sp. TaxID=114053 RepID=UPI002616AE6D|nr:hypothetical protein [uncultured Pseudoalteromonas sp.]